MNQSASDVRGRFAQAVAHHQAGRLAEAIAGYGQVLALSPELAAGHNNLGSALCEQGRLEEAEASYRRALALQPRSPEAHNNLGTVLFDRDRLDEAISCYRQSITLDPGYAEAHDNLGSALNRKGLLGESEISIRKALSLNPNLAQAHGNLGALLWEQGRLAEAVASTSRAVLLAPHFARALDNLGAMLMDLGRTDEAMAAYQRLVQVKPGAPEGLNGLAGLLAARGETTRALALILQSLEIRETTKAKRIFADIVRSVGWTSDDPRFRARMVQAMAEAWLRPNELAHAGARLIKHSPQIGPLVARAAEAWPRHLPAGELYGTGGLAVFAADELLCTLLVSAHNADIDVERFLTMARRVLLDAGAGNDAEGLAFYAALAFQCFLNDYVFFHDDDEFGRAQRLRDALIEALAAGTPIAPLRLLAVAAYFPLHALEGAARLLEQSWPAPVAAVIAQQVGEPLEEARIRDGIPRWTAIEREVSRRVRSQYEENPYPRWVRIPAVDKAVTVAGYLSHKFPHAAFQRQGDHEVADILCACCGAGQMALEIAQSLKGRVLGVDLSLKSLGYAQRKAHEMDVSTIEFAQADVMELGSIGRSFDLVECSGALHYFADPFAGWRVLLSLLRPGGHMLLGLYSKVARRRVMAARRQIADWGYGGSANDIRRCREDLRNLDKNPDPSILSTYDFFGISTCRDMLFHVQEQQLELPEIAAFLKENGLTFLGFETDKPTLEAYRRRFPGDPAATNLDNWQAFENDNPEIFARMYMFWIQKAAPSH